MIHLWLYIPEDDNADCIEIGSQIQPVPPDCASDLLVFVSTEDPEQAEEWRQALAKGEIPVSDPSTSNRVMDRFIARLLRERHGPDYTFGGGFAE